MLTLTGNLVVNPQRPGDFRKKHKLKTVVVEFNCRGLPLYYINQLHREFGPWLNLAPPMFGLHVTIVKGTETFNEPAALKLQGQVKLIIDPTTLARTDWSRDIAGFWTMKVAGSEVKALRSLMAVKQDRYGMTPHLTVARENGVFFMPAQTPKQAELKGLINEMLTMIPQRGGNQWLVADLLRVKKLNALQLLTGEELIVLVHKHLNFPTFRKAADGGRENWEQEVLQLFKKEN